MGNINDIYMPVVIFKINFSDLNCGCLSGQNAGELEQTHGLKLDKK